MFPVLILALLFLASSEPILGQVAEKQEVLIFNGLDEVSTPFYMWTRKNEFDLISYRSLDMDGGRGHRLCYIGGLTVYTGLSFTGSGFFVPYSPSFACTALLPGVGYKSFRFAGLLEDATASSLSFYAEPHFIGQQTVISSNQPNIGQPVASIYKTGTESWSLFLQPNYGGISFCMSCNAVVDVASLGVAPGDIKSARIECSGSSVDEKSTVAGTNDSGAQLPVFQYWYSSSRIPLSHSTAELSLNLN